MRHTIRELTGIADRIRRGSIESTSAAGSGHPTSSLSCADILSALFFHAMRYDVDDPGNPANDRFVLSKGHAAPALWAALAEAGVIVADELRTLRRIDSDLEGHPTRRCRFVDVPTGSLGQGLSMGLGMALWSRDLGIENRVWVLLGDGECAEGSVWEAAMLAEHYAVDRICAIVDVNGLGQTGETMPGHDCEVYRRRFTAFGWASTIIDGHDMAAIVAALDQARESKRPCAIIASTLKGKGVGFLENALGRHGKALDDEEEERALAEMGPPPPAGDGEIAPPPPAKPRTLSFPGGELPPPDFPSLIATRQAYGAALAAAMDGDERLIVLDAEVSNSTGAGTARKQHPQRFIECFIAEQNMVGMALGMAALGAIPCVSTFAAFLSRAADQLRTAGQSEHHLVVAGSHAGVSIGEDGPSQMGLEDVAIFRAIHGASVLCPADGVSCYHLLPAAIAAKGLVYLRLCRPDRPLIYRPSDRDFRIGGSRLLSVGTEDRIAVIACGICVHEALVAADRLGRDGIGVRVIDAYSLRPLDVEGIVAAATGIRHLITVEDHYRAGGLGEAMAAEVLPRLSTCGFTLLAVDDLPRSGEGRALMARHRIDADAIVDAVVSALVAL